MRLLLTVLITVAIVNVSFSQDCEDLFFSEYLEGTGNNKGIEIYNPTDDIIELNKYYVARYGNGYLTYDAGGITQLQGFILPGTTYVLINGQTSSTQSSPACDPALQKLADQLDHDYPAPTYMTGNDAIALLKTEDGNLDNAVTIDLIGRIGHGMTDAMETGWTIDHSLVRKPWVRHGIRDNSESFLVSQEWEVVPGGVNVWDSLGSHNCECGSAASVKDVLSSSKMQVFPNPVYNGNLMIYSVNEIEAIEIYNITGHLVYQRQKMFNRGSAIINMKEQPPGVYILRTLFTNKQSDHVKILVQ